MDGVISCDMFEYLWRNISLSEGGDGDTIDDDISDKADGEFLGNNNYVVNNNDSSDNDSDSDNEEEEEEEEDMKDNNNNNNDDDSSIMIPSSIMRET